MIEIYTDGSAAPNPGPGGAAAIARDSKEGIVWYWFGYEENTTNNRLQMT